MEGAAQGGGFNTILMIFLAFMIVYFIFSARGQKKKDAQRQQELNALSKGDKIVIFGGIMGTVDGFKNGAIEVKISENNKVTVLKSGIVHILGKDNAEAK